MRVGVVHNAIAPGESDPSTLDVLEQAQYVCEALSQAGHEARCFTLDRDVRELLDTLLPWRPECIFNLVESIGGHAALHPCAAALWELLGIPHTGASTRALEQATDKDVAKIILRAAGIPTPSWRAVQYDARRVHSDNPNLEIPLPCILKPASEDASLGIDQESVVRDPALFEGRLADLRARFPRQKIVVEQFIEGREFNVSVIGTPQGPRVLPPAEMTFLDFPPGLERIMGYRAKWDPTAPEFDRTVRRFDLPAEDDALVARLKEIAGRCWRAFGLHGYARVDLRVDAAGEPYVIEINPNPCISPDAGFIAAVERAGITPADLMRTILEDVVWIP